MGKKIGFLNSRGDRLCGVLAGPKAEGGASAAVLCHGFATGKDGRTYTRLEAVLNRWGIATLRFDFFGHGESEGELEDITISEALDDVEQALRCVREQGFDRVALVGSSFGGMAALLAAARDPDLICLALKSPVSDYLARLLAERDDQEMDEWRTRGFVTLTDEAGSQLRLNYRFCVDAEKVRGYDAAAHIRIPTLIVHGDKDETVPLAQSRRLAALLPRARLEVIPGADHRYSRDMDFEKMISRIAGFIQQQVSEE